MELGKDDCFPRIECRQLELPSLFLSQAENGHLPDWGTRTVSGHLPPRAQLPEHQGESGGQAWSGHPEPTMCLGTRTPRSSSESGGAGCAAPAPQVPGLLLQIVGAGPPLPGPTPQGPWLVVFDLSAGFPPCLGGPCPPLTCCTQGGQPEGLAHATPWSSLQPLSFREGHGAQWPIAAEG